MAAPDLMEVLSTDFEIPISGLVPNNLPHQRAQVVDQHGNPSDHPQLTQEGVSTADDIALVDGEVIIKIKLLAHVIKNTQLIGRRAFRRFPKCSDVRFTAPALACG